MLVQVQVGNGCRFPAHVDLPAGLATLPLTKAEPGTAQTLTVHWPGIAAIFRTLKEPEYVGAGLCRWRLRTVDADGASRF